MDLFGYNFFSSDKYIYIFFNVTLIYSNLQSASTSEIDSNSLKYPGGVGILLYRSYMGMYHYEGYGFQAF